MRHKKKQIHIRKQKAALQKILRHIQYTCLGFGILLVCIGIMWVQMKGYPNHIAKKIEQNYIETHKLLGFITKHCIITGHINIPKEQILKMIDFKDHKPLVQYKKQKILDNLTQMKQIKYACVHKQYPNTLLIHLKERIPIAQWFTHNKYCLVDQEGFVYTSLTKPINLPIIIGKNAPTSIYNLLNIIRSCINLEQHIQFIERIEQRRWNLILKNGYVIQLPEDENLKTALQNFDYSKIKFNKEYQILDLRFPKQLIYKQKKA